MSRVMLLALVAVLAVAAPAAAAETVVTIPGVAAGGPAKYDKVTIVKDGPASAKHVLVFEPGTQGGAGYFLPDARYLAKTLKGWQIWSIDRRENLLEDHSVLDEGLAGTKTPEQVFEYYLKWLSDSSVSPHFQPISDADAGFARSWGINVAIGDLQHVVAAARKGGRKVVLAGHSLGGSIIQAYASWNFGKGRAGAKDLDGLVFIDGASPTTNETAASAQQQIAALQTSSPFLDLSGTSIPWAAGLFASVGSLAATKAPQEPSILQAWPLLPDELKPPVPATNAGVLGNAIDNQTGPKDLALVQAHLGQLAATGDPRPWVDGGLSTVQSTADALLGRNGIDGLAWFYPKRLSIDAGAVNGGVAGPAQATTGVKATLAKDAKLPMYELDTSLGNTRVLDAVKAFAKRAHAPLVTHDLKATLSHCDPLFDNPKTNAFLKTVVPFLRADVR